MSGIYTTGADAAECEATLLEAVEAGVTLFDTAEIYGPYTNEELLGRVLGGARRDRVVLATKFGFDLPRRPAPAGASTAVRSTSGRSSSSRCSGCRTDRIDLLYQHRVDPQVPIEDVVGAMAELVRAGKVRYLGLSEASAATLRRAHAVHPISALQSEYSLWERGVERDRAAGLPRARHRPGALLARSAAGSWPASGPGPRSSRRATTGAAPAASRASNFDANLRAGRQAARAWRRAPGDPGPGRARLAAGPGHGHRPDLRHHAPHPAARKPGGAAGPAGVLRPVPARPGLCARATSPARATSRRHGDPRPRPLSIARPGPSQSPTQSFVLTSCEPESANIVTGIVIRVS